MTEPSTTRYPSETFALRFLQVFGTLCVTADFWVWFGMDSTHAQRGIALGIGLAGLLMWWLAGRMKKGMPL